MAEVRYVCPACGGSVSEAEYQTGKTMCQTPGCSRIGQPFERREMGGMPAEAPQKPAEKKPWYKFW